MMKNYEKNVFEFFFSNDYLVCMFLIKLALFENFFLWNLFSKILTDHVCFGHILFPKFHIILTQSSLKSACTSMFESFKSLYCHLLDPSVLIDVFCKMLFTELLFIQVWLSARCLVGRAAWRRWETTGMLGSTSEQTSWWTNSERSSRRRRNSTNLRLRSGEEEWVCLSTFLCFGRFMFPFTFIPLQVRGLHYGDLRSVPSVCQTAWGSIPQTEHCGLLDGAFAADV